MRMGDSHPRDVNHDGRSAAIVLHLALYHGYQKPKLTYVMFVHPPSAVCVGGVCGGDMLSSNTTPVVDLL
jgi:hypothetical protein